MITAISAAALLILAATPATAQNVIDKRPDGNPSADQIIYVISVPYD